MNNIKQDRTRPRKVVFYGRVSTEHEPPAQGGILRAGIH